MAYDARPGELDRFYEAIVRDGRIEGTTPATIERIRNQLKAYYQWRERALNEAIDHHVKADEGTKAEERDRDWGDFLRARSSEAGRQFEDMERDTHGELETWIAMVGLAEALFFNLLANVPVARALGQLREWQKSLAEEAEALEDKWENTIGATERQDGYIAAVRNEVLDLFRREVNELLSYGRKVEDGAKKVVDLYAKYKAATPSTDDPMDYVADPVNGTFGHLHSLRPSVEDLMKRALDLCTNKEPFLDMFNRHREDLKTFLDKIRPDVAWNKVVEAAGKARDVAGAFVNSGQQADAREFVDKVIAQASYIHDEYDRAFEDFTRKFQGRYLGDLSDDASEKLLEARLFARFWDDLKGLGVDGTFHELSEGFTRCEELTSSELTDDQRAEVQRRLREKLEPLKEAIRDYDTNFFERLKQQYLDVPLGLWKDKLKRITGWRK